MAGTWPASWTGVAARAFTAILDVGRLDALTPGILRSPRHRPIGFNLPGALDGLPINRPGDGAVDDNVGDVEGQILDLLSLQDFFLGLQLARQLRPLPVHQHHAPQRAVRRIGVAGPGWGRGRLEHRDLGVVHELVDALDHRGSARRRHGLRQSRHEVDAQRPCHRGVGDVGGDVLDLVAVHPCEVQGQGHDSLRTCAAQRSAAAQPEDTQGANRATPVIHRLGC